VLDRIIKVQATIIRFGRSVAIWVSRNLDLIQSVIPRSIVSIKSKEENDQRLAKLNTKNDELRKQLIRMNG
jgi:hypothetical protein